MTENNPGIWMFIRWYDRHLDDMSPDYDKPHHGKIHGDTPNECMRKYRQLSRNHDLSKYTPTEIVGIY